MTNDPLFIAHIYTFFLMVLRRGKKIAQPKDKFINDHSGLLIWERMIEQLLLLKP
jgi:hypothetical protein